LSPRRRRLKTTPNLACNLADQIRKLRPAKWDSTGNLHCNNLERHMAAQGQQRPIPHVSAMSVVHPICMDPPGVTRENGKAGVRSCINVSGLVLELVLWAIMEIRTHPISLASMPRRAISGASSRMRWGDQFSISFFSLADLGGKTISGSHCVSDDHRHVGRSRSLRGLH
jgi:hypothetical protein